ncbi:MAG: DUF4920 domain-containing protein [Flavobacteriaceae bacterium]|jgi:hypothetical protein|nr:DUF4920 domain-containing protein [Flavobacteriaceae bacterium]
MKKITIILVSILSLVACKEATKETEKSEVAYLSYGKKITEENVISKEDMATKYANLKEGDTIQVKFASTVNEVCKSKGCWMKLDLGENNESMVRFTDYGFFVPMDSDHKDVIVDGRAFITKISVEEQQHYAKDAGKSEEEIAMITEPKVTLAFEADGVLMKK